MLLEPEKVRLSRHFMLSDFMGCSSIYTRGIPNQFDKLSGTQDDRLANGEALCEHILEPILEEYGPLSVSYGFISPAVSREIVTYQSPDKPSYHRWDAGAAADILVHDFCGRYSEDTLRDSPIYLAHSLVQRYKLPFSRLITYSESPYICVAASHKEIEDEAPRLAFYENRYMGVRGARPKYSNLSSARARNNAWDDLREMRGREDPFPWKGHGYPTYHGGGRKQLHHMRVSAYTMVTDWLYDPVSVREGARNTPWLLDEGTRLSFAAAGAVYDALLLRTQVNRFSIVQGYVAPPNLNKDTDPLSDWRDGRIGFRVVAPDGLQSKDDLFEIDCKTLRKELPGVDFEFYGGGTMVSFDPEYIATNDNWREFFTPLPAAKIGRRRPVRRGC